MMWPMDEDAASGHQWATPGSGAPETADPPIPLPPPGAGPAGAHAPAGGAPPGPSGAASPPGGSAGVAGVSVPTVGLRPMTVADILDGAFSIIKARPLRLLGIAAVFVVPVHLLAAYLQRNVLGGQGFADFWSGNFDDPAVVADAQSDSGAGELWATILVLVVPALALVFVAAAIARLLSAWSSGEDLPAGALLRIVGRSWWALLASYVLVHVAEAAGALTCYIGTLALMALFSVTAPAIGAEGLGPIEGMKRSARLVGSRFWPVLGINILIAIVNFLLTNALGGLPELLALWFGLDVAWPLLAAGNVIAAVVATPFVAAATVLLYLDLRIRYEGLDIEVAARERIDGAV